MSAESTRQTLKIKPCYFQHMQLCRTFGAHLILFAYPGLTAGPIDCRPFGPDAGIACVMV